MELTPRVTACLGLVLMLTGVAMLSTAPAADASTRKDGRQVVLLSFSGPPSDTYLDPTVVPRIANAFQKTLQDATPIAMRVKAALARTSGSNTVDVRLAVQSPSQSTFEVALPCMSRAHQRTVEALALGRPLGSWANAVMTLPPSSHLAHRLREQGIAASRITWQAVPGSYSAFSQPQLGSDMASNMAQVLEYRDYLVEEVNTPRLTVDDDMEGVAMRAVRSNTHTAADRATPLMVGLPIEQPRPALMQDVVDQELAASQQIVAGGAGSILTAHPFGEQPEEDNVVHTLPALWHIIHGAWHGGPIAHWYTYDEPHAVPHAAVEDATPSAVVRQLDGMDAPMSMDAAAVDRLSDWERHEEPRPWLPDASVVADVVRAWLGGDRAPLSMLVREDASLLVRRGRRLMSVNWPLTGTGIGLALLGIILLSVCSRWCLQRQERKAKKEDLHMRFPLGSHFYEVPFLPGSGPNRDLKNRVSHHDVLAQQQAMLREAELARAEGLAPGAKPSLARQSVASHASGAAPSVYSAFTAAPSLYGAPGAPSIGLPRTPESGSYDSTGWQNLPMAAPAFGVPRAGSLQGSQPPSPRRSVPGDVASQYSGPLDGAVYHPYAGSATSGQPVVGSPAHGGMVGAPPAPVGRVFDPADPASRPIFGAP